MSIARSALRGISRAALSRKHPSTVLVSPSWALRSASLSTSSGGGDASPWTEERPLKPAAPITGRRPLPPPGKCYMAVHITGLDPALTLTQLVQSIAATAPVGMILSARLHPSDATGQSRVWERRKSNKTKTTTTTQKADIIFANENAPDELRRRARDRSFLVRGKPPYVAVNTQLVFDSPRADTRRSRVVRVRGPAGAPGFDEATMRGVLEASPAAGAQHEPVETREGEAEEVEGGGFGDEGVSVGEAAGEGAGAVREMEWRFFDSAHARAFKRALREHYGRALDVHSAPDPCWAYDEMARYQDTSRSRGFSEVGRVPVRRQQAVRRPAPVDDDESAGVYPPYFSEAAADTVGYRATAWYRLPVEE